MKIDDNWRIEADEHNCTLIYEKEIEKNVKGEMKTVTRKSVRYYGSIPSALKSYCRLQMKNADTVQDLLKKIDMLDKKVDSLFKAGTGSGQVKND